MPPGRREVYEAELQSPPFPVALSYVWDAYARLSARRSSNGFGANPIAWSEIDAFIRLTGCVLTPWDIGLIEMIDDLYRAEQAKSY